MGSAPRQAHLARDTSLRLALEASGLQKHCARVSITPSRITCLLAAQRPQRLTAEIAAR